MFRRRGHMPGFKLLYQFHPLELVEIMVDHFDSFSLETIIEFPGLVLRGRGIPHVGEMTEELSRI